MPYKVQTKIINSDGGVAAPANFPYIIGYYFAIG
jgi:hypothetical protein